MCTTPLPPNLFLGKKTRQLIKIAQGLITTMYLSAKSTFRHD